MFRKSNLGKYPQLAIPAFAGMTSWKFVPSYPPFVELLLYFALSPLQQFYHFLITSLGKAEIERTDSHKVGWCFQANQLIDQAAQAGDGFRWAYGYCQDQAGRVHLLDRYNSSTGCHACG